MAGVVCDDDVEAVRSDSQFVDRTVALFLLQDRRPNVEPRAHPWTRRLRFYSVSPCHTTSRVTAETVGDRS